MTQHDFEWADQLFPAFRTDMNNALIALSTRQSGDGAPPLVAAARPNRVYVDVTRKQVLVRDNADTTDFVWDSWAQDRVKVLTDDGYVVLPEDVGRLIVNNRAVPSSITVPQAVGNFGAGWHTEIFNLGAGDVGVYPTTSTVNGAANLVLTQYQGAKLFSLSGNYWAALTGRGTVTKAELDAAVASLSTLVPTGAVTSWAGWGAPPAGWVRLLGGTIGSAASGAGERAHADAWPLYGLLWGHYGQAQAPVNGGRGAAADQDFNANKWITLFDVRGRTIFSVDHGAGRLTGAQAGGLTGHVPGAAGGEQGHGLEVAELPGHTHTEYVVSVGSGTNLAGNIAAGGLPIYNTASNTGATGSYAAHNTVPPGIALGCWIMKL